VLKYWREEDGQLKGHTVSRKSERLVNLTIALLATTRWLTKSEIYRSIDGYNGDVDAKERMFERDKEELRNLGIEIEVGSFDPLFEDEVGYRIRPEKYQIQISSLSVNQLSLISLATQMWRGAVLSSQANSALVKLKSLGIESDSEGLELTAHSYYRCNLSKEDNFLFIYEPRRYLRRTSVRTIRRGYKEWLLVCGWK
jgi:proteasome accessory factor B